MKSNLKPREKERDLHCANLSCDREEQYKKYFNPLPLPPGKKKGGGRLSLSAQRHNSVVRLVERKPDVSGEGGGYRGRRN